MSEFWKRFLREDQRPFSREARPQLFLGAFGKHPGWDDHINGIGLETESLLMARGLLYVDGIGGQINSGEWEKLDEGGLMSEFKHIFLWRRSDSYLLGKIWSSRDGRNRSKYPMIVCAQCAGVPLRQGLPPLLECLNGFERACKTTDSPGEVESALAAALEHARETLKSVEKAPPDVPGMEPIKIDRLFGEGREALFRILYFVRTQMTGYAVGSADLGEGPPCHLRVPAFPDSPEETFSFWSRFAAALIRAGTPVLMIWPEGEPWLDLIAGQPTHQELHCLRATPRAIALTSEVPYGLDDAFRQSQEPVIKALIEGEGSPAGAATAPAKEGWLGKLRSMTGAGRERKS